MKIACTQENLNQGLSIVSSISGKNPNLPILNNVLIKAKKEGIILSSTNLEIGINCSIRGKVEEEGEFTVPARVFFDYINLLNKGNVALELKEQELQIITENNKTRIKGNAAEDFPTIPEIKRGDKYEIKIKDLKEAISKIIFAVASNSARPEINGVYFELKGEENIGIMAATDSFRLAEIKIPIKADNKQRKIVIIPNKTLHEVLRIISALKENEEKNEKKVKIYISEDNQILFSFPDPKMGTEDTIELVSRLIEGNYPEYQEIIPKNHETKVLVERSELINVVKTSSLFTKSGANSIKMEILGNENELTVYSANAETGENLSKISAKVEGEKNEITLNYKYLIDGLQSVDTNEVVLEVINKDVPCLLKPYKKDNYLYIIMPIRA